jgi:hypothetical protein
VEEGARAPVKEAAVVTVGVVVPAAPATRGEWAAFRAAVGMKVALAVKVATAARWAVAVAAEATAAEFFFRNLHSHCQTRRHRR